MLPDGPIWTLLIRVTIILLRSIAPLSILHTALFFTNLAPDLRLYNIRFPLEIITITETTFYLLVYLPRSLYLQRPAKEGNNLSRHERQELFTNCINNVSDLQYFLRTWFRGAPVKEIRRADLESWLAWGLWNRYSTNQIDPDELNGYVSAVERKLGHKFKDGAGRYKPVRISVDKINIQHRPLLWYLIIGLVDTLLFFRMWRLDFQHFPVHQLFRSFSWRPLSLLCKKRSPAQDISYWYRPHTSKKHLPILYIHGIGVGLFTYTEFLSEIIQKDRKSRTNTKTGHDEQIGIIAIEIMPISFRITSPTLQRQEMVRQITQILRRHGWIDDGETKSRGTKFVLAANSYGTIIANYLLHDATISPSIGPTILIDPITVWVHMGDIAYNFTVRSPKSASERELHYFACTDMGAAHAVTRRFVWTENVLWRHEMVGRKFLLVLSGRDIIFDAERCRKYLLERHDEIERSSVGNVQGTEMITAGEWMRILWFRELNHAEVFERKKERKVLADAVWRCCSDKG